MKPLMLMLILASNLFAGEEVYVGWVSDSGCALARASAGKFTPTNPDCARKCIREGKSVVLISTDTKTVFTIANPAALKSQIGNKVRVYGTSTNAHALQVDKVVFIEETNPECERPPLKN